MSIDTKLELAKQEYVNAINKINTKYGIPLCLAEILLGGILQEVINVKNNNVSAELTQLEKEQREKAKKKGKKHKKGRK
ncbi:MAG TPA: hypothetical protein DCE23_04460 [Firmicutes bacterium]|nr:hypothetical protein [Bacillota bacterium]